MDKLAPVASPAVSTVLLDAGLSVQGVFMTGEGPLVGADVVEEDFEEVWDDCVGDEDVAEGVLLAEV